MTLYCLKDGCDRSWPRDPALEVACPTCQAPIGQRCKRPSGHPLWREPGGQPGVHAKRDIQAAQAGHYGPCPSGRCGLDKAEQAAQAQAGHPGTRHRARATTEQAGLAGLPLFEPELPL